MRPTTFLQSISVRRFNSLSAATGPRARGELSHHASTSGGGIASRSAQSGATTRTGNAVYPQEWWHFDYKDWKQYPILNMKFEDFGQ
jgi:D-alanyl-D-alanine dipeptidase